MSKRNPDLKSRERQLEALAEGESHIRERLLEMRSDVGVLMHALDRLTCQPPRIHAGTGPFSGFNNLLRFPRMR
jgi:hypothetical protein